MNKLQYESGQSGYLEMIVGSMFSGKTSELQRRLKLSQIAGYQLKAFKYIFDNRYGQSMNTHDSISFEAEGFKNINEILEKSVGYKIVGVDEIQFALLLDNYGSEEEYRIACEKALSEIKERVSGGTHFIFAGLPVNFRGEPFNYFMQLLMSNADILNTFTAICTYRESDHQCNQSATRTQRIINGQPANYYDPLILIDAQDHYEARCPKHHFVPKATTSQLFN